VRRWRRRGPKIIELHYYVDPGHGWLKTTIETLEKYGISEKISGYSYREGDNVWLEEDSDAPKLINALRERGIAMKMHVHQRNTSSPIRRKPPYQMESMKDA